MTFADLPFWNKAGRLNDGGRLTEVDICGLYYKPVTIKNDDTSVINKLETSVNDDARVIIYDRHMFIVQATECRKMQTLIS